MEGKLVATKEILKWTKKYEAETDCYLSFLQESTEESEGEKIKTTLLWNVFKIWWRQNMNTTMPGRNNALKGIQKHIEFKQIRFGSSITTGIVNRKIIVNEMED